MNILTPSTRASAVSSSRLRLLTLSCLPVLLAACGTVTPVAFTQDEVTDRVTKDRQAIYADQEPVTGPIGFHEASARALKYNLDYRLKLLENALAQSLTDVAQHEMLPKLVASAGYVTRNNDSGGRSIGIEDRVETLRPSTSQERPSDRSARGSRTSGWSRWAPGPRRDPRRRACGSEPWGGSISTPSGMPSLPRTWSSPCASPAGGRPRAS